jgi:outer membrane protein OmpA-like peptidoglycan-associated protein
MRRIWVTAVALLVVAHLGQSAFAAPTETGESGLVTIPTTEVLAPWHFSIGTYENGEADNEQPELHDIQLYRTEFSLGVGLLPNLEFSTQLPFVQFERGVAGHRHTDDIGDLRLNLKYRLLNEADGAPVSIALLGAAVIGTGRDSFPAILDRNTTFGRRETYEVMGILDKILWTTQGGADATLTLNAGGLFFDKPQSFSVQNQTLQFQRHFIGPNATFQDQFELGAGLKAPLFKNNHVETDLLGEFRGNTGTISEVRGARNAEWAFAGVRFNTCTGIAVQGGMDFGLSGFLEPYRFIAGLTYAMPAAAPPPPAKVAQAPPPALRPSPPPTPKKKIVLRGVHFDFDKSNIRADSVPILRAAADTLKENADVDIVVEGHTDGKGTEAYNQRLSVRRATAVRDYLAKLGIPGRRMTVRGKGKSQPVAGNDTDEGRAQNRRVELLVQP